MAKPSCNTNDPTTTRPIPKVGMRGGGGGGGEGPIMYKNKLQEYTQKQGLAFPSYRTSNEGFQHAPKFRSTVFVDGAEYTSSLTFPRLKEAQQDAAKFAYQCILTTKPLLLNPKDSKSSKSILHEMALKKGWDIPKYSTKLSEGSVFVSTVTVGGNIFIGDGSKNRREAEQFAANSALHSFLGTSSRETLKNQNMNKKRRYDACVKVGFTSFKQRKLMSNDQATIARPSTAPPPSQHRSFRIRLGTNGRRPDVQAGFEKPKFQSR